MVTWMQDSGAGSGVEGIADTEHCVSENRYPRKKQIFRKIYIMSMIVK